MFIYTWSKMRLSIEGSPKSMLVFRETELLLPADFHFKGVTKEMFPFYQSPN